MTSSPTVPSPRVAPSRNSPLLVAQACSTGRRSWARRPAPAARPRRGSESAAPGAGTRPPRRRPWRCRATASARGGGPCRSPRPAARRPGATGCPAGPARESAPRSPGCAGAGGRTRRPRSRARRSGSRGGRGGRSRRPARASSPLACCARELLDRHRLGCDHGRSGRLGDQAFGGGARGLGDRGAGQHARDLLAPLGGLERVRRDRRAATAARVFSTRQW